MQEYSKYEDAAFKSAENYASKILNEIHKGVSDSGLKLVKLVEIIPNWETYLTPKQLETTTEYVKCLNACEVDYKLNLNIGTTQQRLFGNSTSKGALGRLEEIARRLEKQGYFQKQQQIAEKQNQNKRLKPIVISDKTKQEVRELLKLIVDLPDYETYLNNSQKERIFQFLRLKSFKQCAKYFNITEVAFKQNLLGKSGQGGILGKLRQIVSEKTVNDWNDI